MASREFAGIFSMALIAVNFCTAQTVASEKFEVASVKMVPPERAGQASWNGAGGTTFTATNVPLRILVQMAYAVDEKQVSGEDLLGSEQYDISAKPESGLLTDDRLKAMLVSLLAERFGLVIHRETKVVSGYALMVAKSGSKLRTEQPSAGQSAILPGRLIGRGVDTLQIASLLGRPLGTSVTDKTGIEGKYDIDLKFAREGDTNSPLPSIFTAIQEQLGLRLEPQKVTLEMLVIDHCNRLPTEN